MLMTRPKRPRLHRRGGRGGPRILRRTTQVMEMKYVVSNEVTELELMALKATVLPMLIKESKEVRSKVSRTELSGIFQPGMTLHK